MDNLNNTLSDLVSIWSITRSNEEIEIIEYTENLLKSIINETKNSSWIEVSLEVIKDNSSWIFHWWVICNIKSNPDIPNVWLLWHLDVVPVVKNWWNTNPFELVEEEDRFFWRWSCDMKAWVSIMIEILKESLKNKPNKNISLLFTSWEEKWIPNWLTELIKSDKIWKLDLAIALEPTWWKINTWVFWYFDWEFIFKWKSCHSSKPSLWENAIHKIIPLLDILNNPKEIIWWLNYAWEYLEETLSATKIEWWIASNIVPDLVKVQINHRYSPERVWNEVENKFSEIQKKVLADQFIILEHNNSSDIIPVTNKMLIEFVNKTNNDIEKALNVVPFWSDIAQFSWKWISSINFWPWDIAQAHTDNEFLMKDSFEKNWKQFKNYLFDDNI